MRLFADPRSTYWKSEYVWVSLDMVCPTRHVPFFRFIDVSLHAKSRTEISDAAAGVRNHI